MKIDKKAINYYYSFFEVSKELNQKQFFDFNMAIYKVMFFEEHIDKIEFKDAMLNILWKSVKHSLQSSVEGYCNKKSLAYDECFEPLTNPLTNPLDNNIKDKKNEEEKEKEKEEGVLVESTTEKSLAEKTIDYLNEQAGKNFTYTKGNLKEINSQIKKGYGEQEFAYVIEVKVKEWINNPEMNKNLNPVTLFRESNFDRYLNQSNVGTQQEKKLSDKAKMIYNHMKKKGFSEEEIRTELEKLS